MADIAASFRTIRAQQYDDIIDSQGLLRTAMMTGAAHGRRHGYDRPSIREPMASYFYDVHHRVDRNLHAVERNRILCGLALGYRPQGSPDFGLDRRRFAADTSRYAVMLHVVGLSDPTVQWLLDRRLKGVPTMAVNTIAALKNTGLSEKDIVYRIQNGMTDAQGQAEAAGRQKSLAHSHTGFTSIRGRKAR